MKQPFSYRAGRALASIGRASARQGDGDRPLPVEGAQGAIGAFVRNLGRLEQEARSASRPNGAVDRIARQVR
jgi:hypothetical protein